jgi:hypothetical protein
LGQDKNGKVINYKQEKLNWILFFLFE